MVFPEANLSQLYLSNLSSRGRYNDYTNIRSFQCYLVIAKILSFPQK